MYLLTLYASHSLHGSVLRQGRARCSASAVKLRMGSIAEIQVMKHLTPPPLSMYFLFFFPSETAWLISKRPVLTMRSRGCMTTRYRHISVHIHFQAKGAGAYEKEISEVLITFKVFLPERKDARTL